MDILSPTASGDAVGPANGILHLAAGSFARDVATIWPGALLADYLCAPDERRQVWHAWLAARTARVLATDAGRLHRHLMHAKGRDLVTEACGVVPDGALKALAKLGPAARPAPLYRTLMRVLAEGGAGAKAIRHASTLPDDFVAALGELPADLRVEKLARRLESPGHASLLRWAHGHARRRGRNDAVDGRLAALLTGRRSDVSFGEALEALLARPRRSAFPPAPWPGTDRLVPIATPQQQRAVARRFRNCLAGEISSVAAGRSYFYLWRDEHPAVVGLRRVGDLGWYVDEVKGPGNADVGRDIMAAIADAFGPAENIFAGWLDVGRAWWLADDPRRDLDLSYVLHGRGGGFAGWDP